MKKEYRVIEQTSWSEQFEYKITYYLQQKKLWNWKIIDIFENRKDAIDRFNSLTQNQNQKRFTVIATNDSNYSVNQKLRNLNQ